MGYMANDGKSYENAVYRFLLKEIENGSFVVSQPNVKIEKGKKYYSRDREDYIQTDVSIEKYFSSAEDVFPALIIIVECKDYKERVTIDDVEEFHAKLQQIGADRTIGIMVTPGKGFQRSAKTYARSKGITLAKLDCDSCDSFADAVYCPASTGLFSFLNLLTLPIQIAVAICEASAQRKQKSDEDYLVEEINRILSK